ncbi:MAG: lipoyl domain-containing protein [Hyphomicrobiales bacterium]|jgi:pyruvate/2-oxoglutarate dehydrogenase complex dihydrolipoamide acyltransferase (E2) component|nr:lipoyl domain-containing protein [Hyphomicrobiales bacterium]
MNRILKMPRMGMNVDEGTIVEWHKKPGERFVSGEALYSIETDKTTAQVEAPCDGVLESIDANVGDDVSVGDNICSIIDD